MTWYAAQTRSAFLRQSIARHGLTRLERDLHEAGVSFYLPMELREMVHRRTKQLCIVRAPLIPGYVFLLDVSDWPALDAIRSLGPVVRNRGEPVRIADAEIDRLRLAEIAVNEANAHAAAKRREASERWTARKLARHFPQGVKVRVTRGILKGQELIVEATTGRATVKAMADMLGGYVELSAADLEAV